MESTGRPLGKWQLSMLMEHSEKFYTKRPTSIFMTVFALPKAFSGKELACNLDVWQYIEECKENSLYLGSSKAKPERKI